MNTAVHKFARYGFAAPAWRGPVLVTRFAGRDGRFGDYRDNEIRDVRSAADYFTVAWRNWSSDPKHELVTIINCPAFPSKVKYLQRLVGGGDKIRQGEGSGIANLLVIPLLIRKLQLPEAVGYSFPDRLLLRNEEVKILMVDMNAMNKGPKFVAREQSIGEPEWDEIVGLPVYPSSFKRGMDVMALGLLHRSGVTQWDLSWSSVQRGSLASRAS